MKICCFEPDVEYVMYYDQQEIGGSEGVGGWKMEKSCHLVEFVLKIDSFYSLPHLGRIQCYQNDDSSLNSGILMMQRKTWELLGRTFLGI